MSARAPGELELLKPLAFMNWIGVELGSDWDRTRPALNEPLGDQICDFVSSLARFC